MNKLDYLYKIDKTSFSVSDIDDDSEKEEVSYWLKKTPEERFIALEILRQRFFNYDSHTARLQRIIEVV
jgi:hypothetical protein